MAEPIKVPVQVELSPDVKGVQTIGMAINQALGGGAPGTQGSGQPPKGPAQAMASAMQQSQAAMQALIASSSQLQRNLQQIVALAKQMPGALGGGGGPGGTPSPGSAPGTPGQAPTPGTKPATPVTPVHPRQGHWRYQGYHGWSHGINALTHLGNNPSESGLLETAGSIAQLFGPKGVAVGAGLQALGQNLSKEEQEAMERIRLFRQGGAQLRGQYHELTAGTMAKGPIFGHDAGTLQAAGLTKEDIRSLLGRLGRDATQGNIMDVGRLEAGYGVGSEAAGLLGAVKRGGGDASRDALARAIGLHVASGLERSRFGEAFTMMSAVVAKQSIADAQKAGQIAGFIGTAGEQYKGDTSQAHTMLNTLTQMATGAGGPGSEIMALSTMMAGGKSYAEARTAMSRGIGAGGADPMATVKMYAEMPAIKSLWQQGKQDEAAMTVSMISGQPQGIVKDILARYYAGGIGDVTAGHMGVTEDVLNKTTLPEGDRGLIDAKNRSDYLWDRSGAFGGFGGVGDASKRIAADQGNTPLEGRVGPVNSVGEFQGKYGNNFGQQRTSTPTYDAAGNMSYKNLPEGETRTHGATDMTFPPGTPVFSVMAGTVKEVVSLGENYGWVIAVKGEDGMQYRYVHLDQKPPYNVGDKIPAGAPLGVTIRRDKFLGGSKSHLHLGITDKGGNAVNPFKVLGTEGLNRLMGQAGGAGGVGPDGKPTSPPAPQAMTKQEQVQAAMAVQGLPGAGLHPIPLHLLVTVDDRRVSVQQAAARDNMGGGAGMVNTARR